MYLHFALYKENVLNFTYIINFRYLDILSCANVLIRSRSLLYCKLRDHNSWITDWRSVSCTEMLARFLHKRWITARK